MSAGLGYRRFALENRGLYTIMFLHRFRNFEPSPERSTRRGADFQTPRRHRRALSGGPGLFVQVRASDAAQVIWSACHGYVVARTLGASTLPATRTTPT